MSNVRKDSRAYRVRPGFRFPEIEQLRQHSVGQQPLPPELEPVVKQLIRDGETFIKTLQEFLETLRKSQAGSAENL